MKISLVLLLFCQCSSEKPGSIKGNVLNGDNSVNIANKQRKMWEWRNHKYSIKQDNKGFETIIRFLSGHRYSNNPDFIVEIQKKGKLSFVRIQEYLDKGVIMNNEKPRSFMCTIELLPDTSFQKVYQLVKSLPIEKVENKPIPKGTLYHDVFLGYEFFDKGFYKEINFNKPFPKQIWKLSYEILKIVKFKTETAKAFAKGFNIEFKKMFPPIGASTRL